MIFSLFRLKKVSIITVNFNQATVTEEFISSVIAHNTYEPVEIWVVDNGSTRNSCPDWEHKYKNLHFIRSEKNLGFAGGNNLAIKQASGDYLFLVNNDTEFTPGLIEVLVNTMDSHPETGMISPKIRYFDKPDIIQYAGFTSMNFKTGRNKCIGQYEKDLGQYDQSTGQTGYVHGAAMMVRKEAIDKAGMMDESYFLYYEEMDWCERIRSFDYQIWLEPRALIYHKESISVGKKSALKEYYMTRNRIRFVKKNTDSFSLFLFRLHFCFLVSPRNIFSYLINFRFDLLKAFLNGAGILFKKE